MEIDPFGGLQTAETGFSGLVGGKSFRSRSLADFISGIETADGFREFTKNDTSLLEL